MTLRPIGAYLSIGGPKARVLATIPPMTRLVPTLLQRLRRHKGGWVLLFAALMIKIAASTVCVLDGPALVSVSPSSGHTLAVAAVQADVASSGDTEICLLDEGNGCHCACAHGAALPMACHAVATLIRLPEVVSHLPEAPPYPAASSLLRPPIA
ncbi:hypothetical protein SAMN02800691_0441 [Luteibacter sp. UNCMF366Tsu5.1]|nr:hypothetical protein SAMN02800691_0441 [Luteibacter sp. UNCMF366Tsu5.1]